MLLVLAVFILSVYETFSRAKMFVIRRYEFVRLTNQFVLLLIDPSHIVMVNVRCNVFCYLTTQRSMNTWILIVRCAWYSYLCTYTGLCRVSRLIN